MERYGSGIFHESNYTQSSFSAFQDMRIKKEFTDVVIKVRDREYPVHFVVLAARIPYFQKFSFLEDKKIELNELDPDVVEDIINFSYEGKIKITEGNVQQVFFAAVYLQLYQIQQICLRLLANRFSSNNDPVTSPLLKVIPSDEYILQNFDQFSKTDEFLFLPYCVVKVIFSTDNLKVTNEEKVFEALIKWTKVALAERQHLLPYLLTQIRMNYLTSEFLIERVGAEGLIKMCEQCKYLVEEAKNCHLLKKRKMSLSFNTNPRLYVETCRNVCDSMTIVTDDQSVSHYGCVTSVTASQHDAAPAVVTRSERTVQVNATNTVLTTNQNVAQGVASAAPVTTNQSVAQGVAAASLTTNQSMQEGATTISTANQNVWKGATTISATNQNARKDVNSLLTLNQNVPPGGATTVMTTNWSSQNDNIRNAIANTSAACNVSRHLSVSNIMKHGVYAVRSFSSVGSFVSYYDCESRKWDNFPKYTKNEPVLQAVSMREKLYVFYQNTLETFSLVSHEWTVLEPIGSSIKGAGIASFGSIIYLFGGRSLPNMLRRFYTRQNKWLENGTMKYPCRNMSVISAPSCIFITGGYGPSSCKNAFLQFHPITKWTELPPMNTPRADHGSAVLNNKVYVCGGHNGSVRFLSSVEVFDKSSKQWTYIANPKVCRDSPSLISWDNRLYLFGGRTEKENGFYVEVYDPTTNKWLPGASVTLHDVRAIIQDVPYAYHSLSLIHSPQKRVPVVIRGVVADPKD